MFVRLSVFFANKPYPLTGQGFFVRRESGGNASGCPADDCCNVRAVSRYCPLQRPGSVPAVSRQQQVREQSVSSPEPGNDHGHGQSMSDWLRSRRPGNGDAVNALETGFEDRHHPLTSVEAVQVRRRSTVEMR